MRRLLLIALLACSTLASAGVMQALMAGRGQPGAIGSLPSVISTTPANATITLLSNGTYSTSTGGSGNWVTPTALASSWEVRVTVISGSLSTGTTGTWLAMTSNRTWERNTLGVVDLQFDFRDAVTQVVYSTQFLTLEES